MKTYMTNVLKGSITRWSILALVSAAGLALAWMGQAGQKFQGPDHVPQPMNVHGTTTIYPDGTFEDAGEGTYFGRFHGEGTMFGLDQSGIPHYVSGTTTAANGDKSYWYIDVVTPEGFIVVFDSGTGRFEGDSGGFVAVTESMTIKPDGSVTFTYRGEGTITFAR